MSDFIKEALLILLGGGLLGGLGAWLGAKIQEGVDAKLLALKAHTMEREAEEKYADAVKSIAPDVAKLKAGKKWGEPEAKLARIRAINRAECDMTKAMKDWIEEQYADPQAWKETLVDHLVETIKAKKGVTTVKK